MTKKGQARVSRRVALIGAGGPLLFVAPSVA